MLAIPRLACVLAPNLPIQIERRRYPSPLPLVITHPIATETVLSASVEAVRSGVQAGMSLTDARTMAPFAKIIEPNEDAYHQEHDLIRKTVKTFSQALETTALGEFTFDMRGQAKVHGSEPEMVRTLVEHLRKATQLAIQVGIGTGKFIAQSAARFAKLNEARVIPSGEEAGFVAPMAIHRVPEVPKEVRRRITMLDIRTMGELSALRKSAVLREFGGEAAPLYELARGHDPRPLLIDIPPLRVVQQKILDEPVQDRQIIVNHIARLARQVSHRLQRKWYHTEALKLVVYAEGRPDPIRLEWGYSLKPPTDDEAQLFRLALLLLDRMVIGSPVERLVLCAYPLRAWYYGLEQRYLPRIEESETQAAITEKLETFEATRQLLIHRFGESSIQSASVIRPPAPIQTRVRET